MAAQLFYLPFPVAFQAGIPAPGATVRFYLTGTTTATPSYTSSAMTTEHAWPVVANAVGRFPDIYLDGTLTYRAVVKSALGSTLADVDPYTPGTIVGGAVGPAGSLTTNGLEIVTVDQFFTSPGTRIAGTTDDRPAVLAAIAYLKAKRRNVATGGFSGLGEIVFPGGLYYLSSDIIHDDGAITFKGFDAGFPAGSSTKIVVAPSKGAFQFYKAGDTRNPNGTSTTSADGSRVEGLYIQGSGTGAHDGIFTGCRIEVDRCRIAGFPRAQVRIDADAGAGHGNANGWRIGRIRTDGGQYGIYVTGGDVNGGYCEFIDGAGHSVNSVYDGSFFGNAYPVIQSATAAAGALKIDGASNASSVLYLYSESDEPASVTTGTRAIIINTVPGGGGVTGLGISAYFGSFGVQGGVSAVDSLTTTNFISAIGVGGNFASWTNGNFGSGLQWSPAGTAIRVAYSNSDANESARITGPNDVSGGNRSGGAPHRWIFPEVGIGTGSSARFFGTGYAAPTTGYHQVGEVVFNANPSTGGIGAWIATTAGTPGTHSPFGIVGAIQAAHQSNAAAATATSASNATAAPTQAEFNALVGKFNQLVTDHAAVLSTLNATLGALQTAKLMA